MLTLIKNSVGSNRTLFLAISIVVVANNVILAQREIYTHPNFNSLTSDHQKIGILPFMAEVYLRPKHMEKLSPEQLERLERDEGLAVQSALFNYCLKRKGQGKIKDNLEVQPMRTTNALLRKSGINEENIHQYTVQELSEILGVHSLVYGTLSTSKPMSAGSTVTLGVMMGFYGPMNHGNITINLTDGKTGTLLWKYDKTLSRGLGSDTQSVINSLMRKASKKWPYELNG